jgi:ribose/xylose/arabinose/galactoside ABC-type transport system permease subunit
VPPARIPRSVLVYGLLGLIPFLAPPLISLVTPAHGGILGLVVLVYGALILSFLGGARWGQEVARPEPRPLVVTLAMLPTLAGFGLLLATSLDRPRQLLAMAALLGLHFFWDAASRDLPRWYTRLRLILTAGAITGLAAMAWLASRGTITLPATTV